MPSSTHLARARLDSEPIDESFSRSGRCHGFLLDCGYQTGDRFCAGHLDKVAVFGFQFGHFSTLAPIW